MQMYLQKVISKKTCRLKDTDENSRSGAGSEPGSVSQWYGSADRIRTKMSRIRNTDGKSLKEPNFMDPQHGLKVSKYRVSQ